MLSTKRLVAAAKLLVAATKELFVVPNFVAVTKPIFFPCKDAKASHVTILLPPRRRWKQAVRTKGVAIDTTCNNIGRLERT